MSSDDGVEYAIKGGSVRIRCRGCGLEVDLPGQLKDFKRDQLRKFTAIFVREHSPCAAIIGKNGKD